MHERFLREIALPGRTVRTPALGFGCGSLTGASLGDANRALAAAFDAGVRHFDVARYYGYGEAEGILGRFLQSRRSQVTITTKFGIDPPKRTKSLSLALGAGRRLVRLIPGVRPFLQRRTQNLATGGLFSAGQAQASLACSLRELGTDHIDFYLLHDYACTGEPPDELLAFLDKSVIDGKVGAFGIGTGFENILQAIEREPRLCGVVQFENSATTRNMERLPTGNAGRLAITHGALHGGYPAVLRFLESHGDTAREWSNKLGSDVSDAGTLSALMLHYAVEANPRGLVLFSSRNPARVSGNVRAVFDSDFSPGQIELFGELVKQVTPSIGTGN